MSNPKEFEENAKVPRIGILGECTGLGVEGRRKRRNTVETIGEYV